MIKTQKHCYFCANNQPEIDYKKIEELKKFSNYYGQILPRRRTGICAKHQRQFSLAIKRARIMSLLIFTNK